MAESLSRKLEQERLEGSIQGINITRGVREINHSQFVDDTLLRGATSTIIAKRFKKVLDSFLNASRGKVNNAKSHIYGWNVTMNNCKEFQEFWDSHQWKVGLILNI
jgi:hypothetical protein